MAEGLGQVLKESLVDCEEDKGLARHPQGPSKPEAGVSQVTDSETPPVASEQPFVCPQTATHPQIIHQETHKPTSTHILNQNLKQIAPHHPLTPTPTPAHYLGETIYNIV